jgi:hypothetical protein
LALTSPPATPSVTSKGQGVAPPAASSGPVVAWIASSPPPRAQHAARGGRTFERRRGVEARDFERLRRAAARIAPGDAGLGQPERADRDGQALAGCGRCCLAGKRGRLGGCRLGPERPVVAAVGVHLDEDVGRLDLQPQHVDLPGQQRDQRELHLRPLRRQHLLAARAGGVGKRDVGERERRPQREAEADPAQGEAPPRRLLHRRDQARPQRLRVHEGAQRDEAREREGDEDREENPGPAAAA